MLYVTTRDNRDAYTAHRALCENFGPDGGRYVPFSLTAFSKEELLTFKEKSLAQTVAQIINIFFASRLTGWDVEFCIGRNAVSVVPINQKIAVAQLWHNLDGKYAYIVDNLYQKLRDTADRTNVSDWAKIAIRIGILFAIYGEMLRSETIEEDAVLDVSVLTQDFSAPMAAWYARKMGLPIGAIICTSTDNGAVWDLLHRGSFNPVGTDTALQLGIERLILGVLDVSAVYNFRDCCQKGSTYTLSEEELPLVSAGFFCTVAGSSRANDSINSIFRTNQYIIDPYAALCCGGIQDYRARSGESRLTLILSEEIPLHFTDIIAQATGVKQSKLAELINNQ